jgi:MoaA/NifB/PqqE/SkfB family radical SAM enzyme
MKVVIQVAAKDSAKAWGILVRHSPGTALPNRTFIVSEEAARALREAGVKFTEISRDSDFAAAHGDLDGERI